jgi:DNA (cytosine-5)-methyltransferase 1
MMRALDLFCGAGGVSKGLSGAGFGVVGWDIDPQPRYPFEFVQGDAFDAGSRWFDFVWASPPCQFATAYRRRKGHCKEAVNLIARVREMLKATGKPYIIENVVGARDWLIDPIQLCGSSFGLDVRRHRLFECSFPVEPPPCEHSWQTPRFPQATNRKNLRSTVEVGVWRIPLEAQQKAMGIDWMTREELSQAIPPAYAEFLGRAAMKHIEGTE